MTEEGTKRMIRSNFSKSTNSTISKLPHSFLQCSLDDTKIPSTRFLDPKPCYLSKKEKKKKKKKHQPNNPINVTRTSISILFYIPLPYQKFYFRNWYHFRLRTSGLIERERVSFPSSSDPNRKGGGELSFL